LATCFPFPIALGKMVPMEWFSEEPVSRIMMAMPAENRWKKTPKEKSP